MKNTTTRLAVFAVVLTVALSIMATPAVAAPGDKVTVTDPERMDDHATKGVMPGDNVQHDVPGDTKLSDGKQTEYEGKAIIGTVGEATEYIEENAKRSERENYNPQTGKEIKIAAKNAIEFKSGTELSGDTKEMAQDKDNFVHINGLIVHINGLIDEVREDDKVEYETEQGRKGLNAVNLKFIG